MLPFTAVLLSLSLVGAAFGQQQHIGSSHKDKTYNVTLDFDDFPTNSSGVGFHPTDPKEHALSYKGVYLQSFTLLNASRADLTEYDKRCSSSWPNSIFASRKEGFAWPSISLYDLSKPRADLAEDIRRSDRSFSLAWVHMKTTGNITGSPDDTFGIIEYTMMRLDPDPRKEPIPPEAGYPGIGRGEPFPLYIGNLTGFRLLLPPGSLEDFAMNVSLTFGPGFGKGVDVIQITTQIYRQRKDAPGFYAAEDWELCLDDIVLDIAGKDSSNPIEHTGTYLNVKADGSMAQKGDVGWEIMEQMESRSTIFW